MDTTNPVPKLPQPDSGVLVQPAPHGANKLSPDPVTVQTAGELLKKCCYKEFNKMRNDNLIQTSFDDIKGDAPYLGATNGFVDSALLAYNKHYRLVLRPEDVVGSPCWMTFTLSLIFYVVLRSNTS
jgi:hypothetical protein